MVLFNINGEIMNIKNFTTFKKITFIIYFLIPIISIILTFVVNKHYEVILLSSILLINCIINLFSKNDTIKLILGIIFFIWLVLFVYFYIKNINFLFNDTFIKSTWNDQVIWWLYHTLPLGYVGCFIILN